MIKIETVGKPYMRYLAKVIPLAFDESMSYYEQLCNFMHYLKDEIAPVINNNAEALEELRIYVNDYFDNLDIQEEVDNKLDEMYENGQLQSLIEEFIDLTVTFTYANVEGMKEATNLINGQYVKTIGFYNDNDNGGATYRVKTLTSYDTIDEITIIALNDPTLIAELIITNQMNVKQFGAKGDNTTDDTSSIQKAFDNCKNIIINNGTYLINAGTSIKPNSNTNIEILNATLKAIPNNLNQSKVLYIDNKNNININGNGIIYGEGEEHLTDTGEWGHCIAIENNSNNISISNITLTNGWGDGLYVKNGNNIKTYNLKVTANKRNGISLVNANDIIIESCVINDNVHDGIDLEPNEDETVKNVRIVNCNFNNNDVGIGNYNAYYEDEPNAIDNVVIENNTFKGHVNHVIKLENIVNYNVSNNTIYQGLIGIRVINSSNVIISKNNISYTDGAGVTLSLSSKTNIDNNIIYNCGDGNDGSINIANSTLSSITNNLVHDGQTSGIYVTGSGTNKSNFIDISYNRVYNCNLKQASYHGIHLKTNVESCYVTHNDLRTIEYAYERGAIVCNDVTNPNNIIAYNILNSKLVTDINAGSNKTCDNIVGVNLKLGNITRS